MGHPTNRTADEHLFHCWNEGMGIASTKKSLSQSVNVEMSTDEIQQAFAKISDRFYVKAEPKPAKVSEKPLDFSKDYDRKCEVCGETPVVYITGMCGPCTFGEADTVAGNW